MKKLILLGAICALAGCAAPQTAPKGPGFGPNTVAAAPSVAPTAAPSGAAFSAPRSALPRHSAQSRYARRFGKTASQRDAAQQALTVGTDIWGQAASELVSLGKFKLKLRDVQVDGHRFIVAEHASNIIGHRKFQLKRKTVELIRTKTNCSLSGDGYFARVQYRMGMVFPISC